MLTSQPVRFQHIGLTAKTSIQALERLSTLRDLRQGIEELDREVEALRATINGTPGKDGETNGSQAKVSGKYDDIEDVPRLQRLLGAREKTKAALEGRVGWATVEKAREEAEKAVV